MGAAREFLAGAGLLARGVGAYVRSPGLMLLGLIPAAITAALFVGAFATLAYFIADLSAAATWFADDWSAGPREFVQWMAAIAILGIAALIAVVAFTAVTLLIGDPFYEKISERVEDSLGGVPGAVERPWWLALRRNLADSLRQVGLTALVGVPLFLGGLIPVVGQFVVPVLGAAVAGWFLAVELTGVPFERRGLRLADRRRALAARRPMAVGFGAAVFVCFLIPLGAVLIMPAAVAGAAMLTRRVLEGPS